MANGRCSGQFETHTLPHETATAVERIGFFISNGSGLAVSDLDNDGDVDLVLGNIFGPVHIFWNDGAFAFRQEVLFEGSVRAVVAVDLDGDGWRDLLFSERGGKLAFWRNGGDGRFALQRLNGVSGYAYAIDVADVDQDGDLDIVTASYDAAMEKIHGIGFEASDLGGVHLFLNDEMQFSRQRLASEAHALALQLVDLDDDGRLDIHVGNDFDIPDAVWLNKTEGWTAVSPFDSTTMSTMSFDRSDVDNDGTMELFAADMHPYDESDAIISQWQPIMDNMSYTLEEDDPQQMANVLQKVDGAQFTNTAVSSNLSATGWSWSSKFGDLDQDGFVDLYVVNGMQALDNFSHLPNDELVEENVALRNLGDGRFTRQDEWSLNSTLGGRSMSMADLDGDGDLDIVVNNLGAPAQLFENQLCEGTAVHIKLNWPNSQNRDAIGAKVLLQTSIGQLQRDVRGQSGYLSGDVPILHFGFPEGTIIEKMTVIWPDGVETAVESITQNHQIIITREE